MVTTEDILLEVLNERKRQEVLKAQGRFNYTCADDGISDYKKLAILVEEVGEASRATLEMGNLSNDKHGADLRRELIQVAAVAVSWVEALS